MLMIPTGAGRAADLTQQTWLEAIDHFVSVMLSQAALPCTGSWLCVITISAWARLITPPRGFRDAIRQHWDGYPEVQNAFEHLFGQVDTSTDQECIDAYRNLAQPAKARMIQQLQILGDRAHIPQEQQEWLMRVVARPEWEERLQQLNTAITMAYTESGRLHLVCRAPNRPPQPASMPTQPATQQPPQQVPPAAGFMAHDPVAAQAMSFLDAESNISQNLHSVHFEQPSPHMVPPQATHNPMQTQLPQTQQQAPMPSQMAPGCADMPQTNAPPQGMDTVMASQHPQSHHEGDMADSQASDHYDDSLYNNASHHMHQAQQQQQPAAVQQQQQPSGAPTVNNIGQAQATEQTGQPGSPPTQQAQQIPQNTQQPNHLQQQQYLPQGVQPNTALQQTQQLPQGSHVAGQAQYAAQPPHHAQAHAYAQQQPLPPYAAAAPTQVHRPATQPANGFPRQATGQYAYANKGMQKPGKPGMMQGGKMGAYGNPHASYAQTMGGPYTQQQQNVDYGYMARLAQKGQQMQQTTTQQQYFPSTSNAAASGQMPPYAGMYHGGATGGAALGNADPAIARFNRDNAASPGLQSGVSGLYNMSQIQTPEYAVAPADGAQPTAESLRRLAAQLGPVNEWHEMHAATTHSDVTSDFFSRNENPPQWTKFAQILTLAGKYKATAVKKLVDVGKFTLFMPQWGRQHRACGTDGMQAWAAMTTEMRAYLIVVMTKWPTMESLLQDTQDRITTTAAAAGTLPKADDLATASSTLGAEVYRDKRYHAIYESLPDVDGNGNSLAWRVKATTYLLSCITQGESRMCREVMISQKTKGLPAATLSRIMQTLIKWCRGEELTTMTAVKLVKMWDDGSKTGRSLYVLDLIAMSFSAMLQTSPQWRMYPDPALATLANSAHLPTEIEATVGSILNGMDALDVEVRTALAKETLGSLHCYIADPMIATLHFLGSPDASEFRQTLRNRCQALADIKSKEQKKKADPKKGDGKVKGTRKGAAAEEKKTRKSNGGTDWPDSNQNSWGQGGSWGQNQNNNWGDQEADNWKWKGGKWVKVKGKGKGKGGGKPTYEGEKLSKSNLPTLPATVPAPDVTLPACIAPKDRHKGGPKSQVLGHDESAWRMWLEGGAARLLHHNPDIHPHSLFWMSKVRQHEANLQTDKINIASLIAKPPQCVIENKLQPIAPRVKK